MQPLIFVFNVSTDMQTEFSPDSQLRLIKDYAKTYDYLIPEEFIYMEIGVSGKSADKRPAFQKMISAAKSSQFETILIYHTNRFARNHEESIVYKSMLKRDCNIDVVSITQPPVDRKTDMLTNAIYSVMDEWYSIDLAANVKRGMTEKAMRGGYQCSPPFGYRIPGYNQAPVIIEEEAKVVRIIFDMYLKGQTNLWDIGKSLNEMGYRTRRGNAWSRRSIEYIIINPAYKGMVVWNKCNNNKSLNASSEWIIAQGSHEPIISPENFDKVQEIYCKTKSPRKTKPPGTYKHWLSGSIKCGSCGRGMTYSYGRYANFGCNGYKKGICPTSDSISQKKAEETVINIILKVSNEIYPVNLDQIVINQEDKSIEIENLKEQLSRIDKKLERYKDAYSAGYDSLEEYGENKKKAAWEQEKIKEKISGLEVIEPDESVRNSIINNTKNIYDKILDESVNTEEKISVLRSLINKIIYNKKYETYDVYFNS